MPLPTRSDAVAVHSKKLGLRHWMERVLVEWEKVRSDFSPDPVHDLRVALRRCRSMAEGLRAVDPDAAWKQMRGAGKKLFSALGDLRDAQVMTEWIDKLSPADDPVAKSLAAYSGRQELELKERARLALESFDRKGWLVWLETLPKRAAGIPPSSLIFRHLALERWTEAHRLHAVALRNRTAASLHRLRIGLKRLRYTVENFLPELHDLWIEDLKYLQDLLGEVHDLDVLWRSALQQKAFPDVEARHRWQSRISEERRQRIGKYREKMLGRNSPWHFWRSQLPAGREIHKGALTRLKLWASRLDPDFSHSQRVTRFALQLHDGLSRNGLLPKGNTEHRRAVLEIASLLHDVGRSKGKKKHHKAGARMVRKLDAPLGYSATDFRIASAVARYHRGALPRDTQSTLSGLTVAQRRRAMLLSSILRLADSLDRGHEGAVKKIQVTRDGDHVVVLAAGFTPYSPVAERVAAARHLLEVVCGCPVLVRPMKGKRMSEPATRHPEKGHRQRRVHSKTSGSRSAKKA